MVESGLTRGVTFGGKWPDKRVTFGGKWHYKRGDIWWEVAWQEGWHSVESGIIRGVAFGGK